MPKRIIPAGGPVVNCKAWLREEPCSSFQKKRNASKSAAMTGKIGHSMSMIMDEYGNGYSVVLRGKWTRERGSSGTSDWVDYLGNYLHEDTPPDCYGVVI